VKIERFKRELKEQKDQNEKLVDSMEKNEQEKERFKMQNSILK
jgi:hypothetical protein